MSTASVSPVAKTTGSGVPVAVQHALVLAAVLCVWGAMPRPAAPVGAWLWDIGGLVLAGCLVLTRRRQPHIDDRGLDRILALGGLVTAVWVVLEWAGAPGEHPFAADAAATAFVLGCLFWILGTRETCWALPAALAPLLGAIPALGQVWAGTAGLLVCLVAGLVLLLRHGPAPRGQLDPVHPLRLIAPALATAGLVLLSRGWSA